MIFTRLAVFLIVSVTLLAQLVWAGGVDDRLRLGERFYDRGDWYRAATLFEEAAMDLTGATAQSAWIRAADAHRRARQWEKAAGLYAEAATWDTSRRGEAILGAAQAHYLGGKPEAVRGLLRGAEAWQSRPEQAEAVGALRSLAALREADWAGASQEYAHLSATAAAADRKAAWAALSREAGEAPDALHHRNPRVAAFLSALLPGAGQVYAGNYGEAAMALTVNAVFGVLIWDAALKAGDMDRNPHRGWAYTTTALYAFVGSSFYFGSMYGAAMGAERQNRLAETAFTNDLKARTLRLNVMTLPLP